MEVIKARFASTHYSLNIFKGFITFIYIMSLQSESNQSHNSNHNTIVNTLKYYDENDINTLTKMNLELGEPMTVLSLFNFEINLPLQVDLFMYKIIQTKFDVDKETGKWYDRNLDKEDHEHQEITYNKIKKLMVEKYEPVGTSYLVTLMENMRKFSQHDDRWDKSQSLANHLATYNCRFKDPTKIDNKYIKSLRVYSAY